jgi:hypothetical protein
MRTVLTRLLFLILVSFSLCVTLLAVPFGELKIPKIQNPPNIDGFVNEDVWKVAAKITSFYQREPDTARPASEETTVSILFDTNHIYFAFQCLESDPSGITAKELARDADLSSDDRIQIILDTFLDQRNGYWFQVGPRGSIGDALVSDNGERFNKQWDGLWDGKAKIHSKGWDAEIVIPFKTLRFRPGQSSWGLKLIRYIKRKEESVYWPTGNLDTYRFQISDSGIITGLEGLEQGVGLDIRPYGLLGLDQWSDESDDFVADAGLDVFYQLTPGLSSALTINTDFAETEVDSRQINLTRFPLFFPEKRDFFLDGSNYFTFGPSQEKLIPFFSRRIGLDSDGNPIPILWGGKVTGQQGAWNLGALGISDSREENNRNFFVSRVSRNFLKQSMLGMIFTAGNAVSEQENQLAGVDLRLASSEFLGNKNISLTLFGLKSFTEGLSGQDTASGVSLNYPNDFMNFSTSYQQIGQNFVAGTGFVPRKGIRESSLGFSLGPRPRKWSIRQLNTGVTFRYLTDFDNRLLTRLWGITPVSVRFDSGDQVDLTVHSQFELLDEDFKIHPDHTIQKGGYSFDWYLISLQTAQRRNMWFRTSYRWGDFFDGVRKNTQFALGYKVAIPLYLEAQYDQNRVTLPSGTFTANISRLNFNILFSPNLTIYNFLQYDNFSDSLGWQSRLQWILQPGNEIIFAWNSSWADPFDHIRLEESTTRFKVNYNFRF